MISLQGARAAGRVPSSKGSSRSRSRLIAGLVAGAVATSLLAAPTPAAAGAAGDRSASARHTRLLRSAPPNDTSLSSPPRLVTLWFTKPVQPKLSRLQLTDASGARVQTSELRATSDSATRLEATVTGSMKPGAYTVAWTTTSRDSHVIKGTVRFKLTGSASLD